MSADTTTHRCPKCRTRIRDTLGECGSCGHPFNRLCICGATYNLFVESCPGCGRTHRRKMSLEYPGRISKAAGILIGSLGRMATRTRRALASPVRLLEKRGKKKTPRYFCPSCRGTLGESAPSCPHCRTNLGLLCRCGARYDRVFDTSCPACGKKVRRQRRSARRVRWAAVGVVLAVLFAGFVGYVAIPRDPGSRKAKYYEEGSKAFEQGRFTEAAGWFGKFLSEDPDHAASRFMRGQSLYRAGSREAGIAEVRRARDLDSDMAEPLLFLAKVALDEGEKEEALTLLETAVRSQPAPREAYLMLGQIRLDEGQTSEAMRALTKAVAAKGEPHPVRAALILADLHRRRAAILGRPDEELRALELYRLVESWSRPGNDDLQDPARDAVLAEAYFGQGKFKQALWRARQAAEGTTGGRRAELLLLQARATAGQGEPEQAGALVADALESDSSPEMHEAVARFWREQGRADLELEALEKARETDDRSFPILEAWAKARTRGGEAGVAAAELVRVEEGFADLPSYHLILSRVLWSAGEVDKALKVLKAARERFPENRSIRHRELSARLDQLGSRDEGLSQERDGQILEEAEQLLIEAPRDPVSLLIRGKSLLYQGMATEARPFLTESVDADPMVLEASILLGFAYYRSGEYGEAALRLKRVLTRTAAELPEARLVLADCYYRNRLFVRAEEAAKAAAKAALQKKPGYADARRLLGKIYLADGRYDDAIREFEILRDVESFRLEAALYLGYLSLLTGKSEEAEEAFARAGQLAETPEDQFRVASVVAEYYRQTKLLDRAVGMYETFVKKHPNHLEAKLGMADFLYSMGRRDEALAAYRKSLTTDPDNSSVRRRICEFHLEEGRDLKEVERQISEMERRSPDSPDLPYVRGKLAVAQGEIETGIAELLKYVTVRPLDPDGQYALGVALMKSGDLESSVARLETAKALFPQGAQIRQTLGQVLQTRAAEVYARGDMEGARDLVKKALGYDPGLTTGRLIMASSLVALGDVANSEEYCLQVIQRDPDNPEALRLLGAVRVRRRDLEGAANALQRAARVSKEPGYDHYLLATVYLAMGKFPAALEHARNASDGSKDPLFAADVVVSALISNREAREAETYVKEIVAKLPESARAHALLGVVRRARSDFKGALKSFRTALDFDPQFHRALWQIVDLFLTDLGDWSGALEELTYRCEESPDDPELNYLMGWLQAQALERDTALLYLEKALRVSPEHRNAVHLYTKLSVEMEAADRGRDHLRGLLRRNPRDAETLFLLASSFDQVGERETAAKEYEKALAADRDHTPSLNNLAMYLLEQPGRIREALSLINRALLRRPGYPAYLDTLGRVHMALKNNAEADRWLSSALAGFRDEQTRLELTQRDPKTRGPKNRARALEAELDRQVAETKAALAEVRAAMEKGE